MIVEPTSFWPKQVGAAGKAGANGQPGINAKMKSKKKVWEVKCLNS